MAALEGKELIEGFEADFESIVDHFRGSNLDLKLKDFIKYWDDKRLDCLFANRFDPRELLESINEINRNLVERLCDTNSQDDLAKVVALYFMLCLFVKQPEKVRCKIRLTCEDVVNIQSKSSNDWQQNGDIGFAWRYLRHVDAIDFVEDRTFYGPSMLVNRKWRKVSEMGKSKLNLDEVEKRDSYEFLEGKIEPDLQELESHLSQYDYLRSQLNIQSDSKAMGSNADGAALPAEATAASVRECLSQARALLSEYKATQP